MAPILSLAGCRHLLLCVQRTAVRRWVRVVRGPDLGVVQVACTAARGEVVPHGRDLDVLLGLLSAAADQRRLGDTVHLTVAELVTRSHLPPGHRGCAAVQSSLRRLVGSTFDVFEVRSGHVPQPWRVIQHRLVVSLLVRGTARAGARLDRWPAGAAIHARLGADLLQAVEAGLFGGLEASVQLRLRSPLARHVYAALAQARVLPDGTLAAIYRAPLLGWAELLGLGGDAAQVLQILSPVHATLQRIGALSRVTQRQAGGSPIIEYHFSAGAADSDSVSGYWATSGRLGGSNRGRRDRELGAAALAEIRLRHPIFTAAPSAPPGGHRTEEDASALLGWRLTRSSAASRLRDQAVRAYLNGHLSEADLIDLGRCSSAAQAQRLQIRRLRRPS